MWLCDGVYGKWESLPVVGFGQPEFNRIAVEVDAPNGRRSRTLTCHTSPSATTTATSRGTATTTSTATWLAFVRETSRPQRKRPQSHPRPSATRSAGFFFALLHRAPKARSAVSPFISHSRPPHPVSPSRLQSRRLAENRAAAQGPRKLFRRGASFQGLRKTQALPGFASSLARPPEPRTADGPRGGAEGPAEKT